MEKITNTIELKKLLSKTRFTVNYYQREYRWGRKQIEQLIEDLISAFESDYNKSKYDHSETKEILHYGYYYMGSIIRTNEENNKEIIDGQQRLTSLTLLLIYLKNLHKDNVKATAAVSDLICSDQCGECSFNIDVPERKECFENLFNDNKLFNPIDESSKNMLERYKDIEELFPQEYNDDILLYFTYWIIEKVLFMEIVTPSEQEAHKVFVTMNDRGLSLNSAEMLKGYLLSEIKNNDDRNLANGVWKSTIKSIKDATAESTEGIVNSEDVDFISTWIRANYANSLRDARKGSVDEDYEIIGNEFHQWVRSNAKNIGLLKSVNFKDFICNEMKIYADVYLRLKAYSKTYTKDYEAVFYNANREMNYQTMMILSAISPNDNIDNQNIKIKLVSVFLDIMATTRIVNFKKINWNSNKRQLFRIMKNIRNADEKSIAKLLTRELRSMDVKVSGIQWMKLNQFTARYMLHILSRLTSHVNSSMGNPSNFENFISRTGKNSYDIEHILPNKYGDYSDLFEDENNFEEWRSKIGNLIILTRDRNRSYQDMDCKSKLTHYANDNILAQSLNDIAYSKNPSFMKLAYDFKPYDVFSKDSIQERCMLYSDLAEDIWNFEQLKEIVGGYDEDDVVLDECNGIDYIVEYNNRSWSDAKNFGFVSAGGNKLSKLKNGDRVFCHKAGKGFLGVGVCEVIAMPVNDAKVERGFLRDCKLDDMSLLDRNDELVVIINWIATVNDEDEGYWEKGLTSLPTILYQLESDYTFKKVLEFFNIVDNHTIKSDQ